MYTKISSLSKAKFLPICKHCKSAFSLIEVTISLIILAVVSIYLATAIPVGFLLTQDTQDVTRASDIAQRYLEATRVELTNYGKYNSVTEGSNPPIAVTDEITNNGYFTVNTDVTFVGPDTNPESLKQIDLVFTRTGDTKLLINLSTVIAKPPKNL